MKKENVISFIKFGVISCGAGIIEIGTFTLLNEVCHLEYWLSYLIGLTLSIVFNFTVNRKVTFKPTDTLKRDVCLIIAYNVVFLGLSTAFEHLMTLWGVNEYVATAINMIVNMVTEFLFSKFVIYRNK